MQRRSVSLPKPATGVVTRPCRDGSAPPQILVFLADGMRQLDGGSDSEPYRLGPPIPLTDAATGTAYTTRKASCALYEPLTDCVYYVEDEMRIMCVNRDNSVSLVAGGNIEGSNDGVGRDARFAQIAGIAADRRGCIYVANHTIIRKITRSPGSSNVPSAETNLVATLPATIPPNSWPFTSLTYDAASDALMAATYSAVCRLPLSGPRAGASMQLLAGDWVQQGGVDGRGAAARFNNMLGILAGADHTVYIVDWKTLRKMDSDGNVTTLPDSFLPQSPHMAILPPGCLAVCGPSLVLLGNDFKPSSAELAGWGSGTKACSRCSAAPPPRPAAAAKDDWKYLLASPAAAEAACSGARHSSGGSGGANMPWSRNSSCGSSSSSSSGTSSRGTKSRSIGGADGGAGSAGGAAASGTLGWVTIRVGDKKFLAHRALLSNRCDYFRWLLAGDFGDSLEPEINLPDADPNAFGHLLGYMYGMCALEDIPDELLQSAVELAGRLLMCEVEEKLRARLLGLCCTPARAVAGLMWADAHSFSALAADIHRYVARNLKQVAAAAPDDIAKLAVQSPALTAQLVLAVAAMMPDEGSGSWVVV